MSSPSVCSHQATGGALYSWNAQSCARLTGQTSGLPQKQSYYPQLLARAAALYAQGADRRTIEQTLNRAGWRPAKRTTTFSALMVGRLLARQGLRYVLPVQAAVLAREAHAWTLQELEQLLGIPEETLYAWLCHGRLTARQVTTASHPRWLIWADAGELDRLRTVRTTLRTWKRPAPRQTPVDEF